MQHSSSNSGGPPEPEPTVREVRFDDAKAALADVLESILARTAAGSVEREEQRESLVADLVPVARQYAAEGLCVRPTAQAMVRVVLNGQFGPLQSAPQLLDAMALQIAGTMMGDAATRGRLLRLWNQLSEMV